MKSTSTPAGIKKTNTIDIINCIRNHKKVCFSDIHKKTGISNATISRNIKFLLEKNLVMEAGIEKSLIGRHARIIEFNFNYRYVIGIHIGESKIRVALTNLDGVISAYRSLYTKKAGEGYEILDKIILIIDDMVREASIRLDDVTAISIGVPGITDISEGIVIEAPNIQGWKDIKVIEYLKDKLKQKIIVDNDANMAVLGESRHLLNNNVKNVVFVSIGTGIGSGIIINGSLYRGKNNASGEVGFMAPMQDDTDGQYTHSGYLESKASVYNLYMDVLEAVKKDKFTVLRSIIPGSAFDNYADFNLDYVDEAAVMNDSTAINVLTPYINYWGSCIVNSISVLAPDIVFVGGDINIKNTYIYNRLMLYVNKYLVNKPNIYFVKEGRRSEVYGALKVGIEYTFENIIYNIR